MFKNPYLRRHRNISSKLTALIPTHVTSVKKIFPLFGWIFTSLRELNCRPKKLSRRTVELKGGLWFTRTTFGGKFARPEFTNSSSPRKFVAPFVI